MRFRLGEVSCERGFRVLLDGAVVGHSRHFHDMFVAALLASPPEFGWVLEAMGAIALERVERITAARLGRA